MIQVFKSKKTMRLLEEITVHDGLKGVTYRIYGNNPNIYTLKRVHNDGEYTLSVGNWQTIKEYMINIGYELHNLKKAK